MFVTIGNTQYKVTWRHGNKEPEPELGSKICECFIVNTSDESIFGVGYSYCHPKDNYVKETGRKMSMNEALLQMFDKVDRDVFWKSYFNRNNVSNTHQLQEGS